MDPFEDTAYFYFEGNKGLISVFGYDFDAGRILDELGNVILKYYYIVGGMPEVVAKWVETHNFEMIEKLQDNILLDYGSDFAKHAPKYG